MPKKAAKTESKKTETTKKATPEKPKRRRRKAISLEDFDFNNAIEYKMDKNYEVRTPIHHKVFGNGVVQNVIDNSKMEVLFEDKTRVMVQNYQS